VIKGFANVRTSFSPVILDDVGGSIDVDNQNGLVELTGLRGKGAGAQCNAIVAKTAFGPIRIQLPNDASYAVSARTSFGRITSDLPLTMEGPLGGSGSSTSVTGKIGGGECELRLTNGNGDIALLRGAPKPK
jgi:DUF4097 and DUF4098 domain-containing protein YvlB